jgi:hypothetical protein
MAKKNFKIGLDNLMDDSIEEIDQVVKSNREKPSKEQENTDGRINWLLTKIDRLSQELKLWRTGKLTTAFFHDSLKANKLKYNPLKNTIEKI